MGSLYDILFRKKAADDQAEPQLDPRVDGSMWRLLQTGLKSGAMENGGENVPYLSPAGEVWPGYSVGTTANSANPESQGNNGSGDLGRDFRAAKEVDRGNIRDIKETNGVSGDKKTDSGYNIPFTYEDKDGNTVTRNWTISDEEFQDTKALNQEQITAIMNRENPGLVERGFDKDLYYYSQKYQLNPKVLLATLGQEQGWCRNGNYKAAFGVGEGGRPGEYEDGGIGVAAKSYRKAFDEGKGFGGDIPADTRNQDKSGKERRAVFGDGTADWEAQNPQYARYMNQGVMIKPVNAAMHAKLEYTPWTDFPPQGSHPLTDWQEIYRSLK